MTWFLEVEKPVWFCRHSLVQDAIMDLQVAWESGRGVGSGKQYVNFG